MKLAIVSAAIPNPDSGGGAITTWSVASHLIGAGHEVSVVSLHEPVYDDAAGATLEQRLEQVRNLGVEIVPIPTQSRSQAERRILAQALRPRDEELMPHHRDIATMTAAVAQLAPDAAFVYGWDAIAATRGLRGTVPRFGASVDLAHLPELYRFRRSPKRLDRATAGRVLLIQGHLRRLPRLQVELLNECEASADFARHHAEWLRRKGATGCLYLHTPIWDAAGPGWRAERNRFADRPRPRILLVGHLRGTATQDGLDFFLEEILPLLERELGPDGFEIRHAGGFDPPPDLRESLAKRPSIRLLGHLPDPREEFAAADCIVVPTTIPLGARVRIITALSFGCPVVAHTSNALGLAELAHEENALLGRTAGELAQCVVRIAREPGLRERLEDGGRAAYERYFALPVAGKAIEDVLERISSAGPAPTPARP